MAANAADTFQRINPPYSKSEIPSLLGRFVVSTKDPRQRAQPRHPEQILNPNASARTAATGNQSKSRTKNSAVHIDFKLGNAEFKNETTDKTEIKNAWIIIRTLNDAFGSLQTLCSRNEVVSLLKDMAPKNRELYMITGVKSWAPVKGKESTMKQDTRTEIKVSGHVEAPISQSAAVHGIPLHPEINPSISVDRQLIEGFDSNVKFQGEVAHELQYHVVTLDNDYIYLHEIHRPGHVQGGVFL